VNNSPQVLVIDDDAVDREAVRRAVIRPGQNTVIHMAATGKEAIGLLQEKKFDCVFLDYHLPDMDGISLLRAVYDADTDLPPSPIVMLTGQGNEAVMADALRWGAQDYVVKDNISRDTLGIAMAKAREMFELKKSRRQAEEQLRQAQKMEAVGQLTSGVAHDFNNLLTVILGNTRILTRRLQPANGELSREDLMKKVQTIEISAQRGAELVRRLMVFTRQRAPKAEVVDINFCVQETAELLSRALGETVETRMVLNDGIWPVQVDVGQFENALINIAVNARDSMPQGGKLTIETHNVVVDDEYTFRHPDVVAGPYVMIAVSDTGHGMPPAIARRIFEPFYTTKPQGQGTGLGLSMVYGFIRQCGGYVHVYSEEGHGTVFRIYLPKLAGEGEAVVDNMPDALPGGSETILVVEDDEEVLAVAVKMLTQLGYKTFTAESGRTALEILKSERENISLVFTDVVLQGGMNGAELARKVQEYYPGIKILYTSGYTESAIPDYKLVEGTELIGKPYRKAALAAKVREILDGKQGETGHERESARARH